MKYIKIAILSIFGAWSLCSCNNENTNFGPGSGVVEFGETSISIKETSSMFTLPLVLSGEPGGYPVTVTISAEADGDIDNILLITSTTIKITEANNSFIQMIPVFNRTENENHEVRLTIESCNGASIGSNNSCTIFINNSPAVHTGQYSVYSQGSPNEWTLLLQDGPDGTYIAGNLFNLEYSPQLVGYFDEETSQLIFDGRIYGFGESIMFGLAGWGMSGEYYLYLTSGEGGDDPLIINVGDDMYLSDTTGTLALSRLYVADDGMLYPYDNPGLLRGNTTFEYAGAAIKEEWPF